MRMYKPNLSFCDPLPALPVATIASNSAKTSNVRATSALPALLGRYPAVNAAAGGTDCVRVVPSVTAASGIVPEMAALNILLPSPTAMLLVPHRVSPAVLVQDRAPVAAQRADDMSINVNRFT